MTRPAADADRRHAVAFIGIVLAFGFTSLCAVLAEALAPGNPTAMAYVYFPLAATIGSILLYWKEIGALDEDDPTPASADGGAE